MIAVDTNILVYAHRDDASFHALAEPAIRSLCNGNQRWTIPWPCVHEFLNVVTNTKVFTPSTTVALAFEQLSVWLDAPSCVTIGESSQHRSTLESLLTTSAVTGPKVHDARIAAICLDHGVRELWSIDRDFSRFPQLKVRNPLIAAG